MLSNEAADVIIGKVLVAVFSFATGLIVVFDFLMGVGGAFLSVVVALQVTLYCMHEMGVCIVLTVS